MLRESTLAREGKLLVSKLFKIPVLLDTQELALLLEHLEKPSFYLITQICDKAEGILSADQFIKIYDSYICFLKEGHIPPQTLFHSPFSSALSCSQDLFYSIAIDEKRHLIKACKPVIQLQLNNIQYSKEDGSIRSQVFGQEGISWGIHFSYPQLYQDSHTQEIFDVDDSFPNTAIFRRFQKWIRYNTMATPFVIEGKRMNEPIRLGKSCFSWINSHRQLKEKGIKIHGAP